jgi:hypothetical protein
VAVLASNAQTMSTFISTQKLMAGLLGDTTNEDAVAKAVVAAAYNTIKAVDTTDASKTLTNKKNLITLYNATYYALSNAMPAAGSRHLLQAAAGPTAAQLADLFGAVANTVSSTNTQVQQVVTTATTAAADTNSTIDTSDLLVNVSKVAAVQQDSLASDIGNLATQFAADPTTNIATLQEVSLMAATALQCL